MAKVVVILTNMLIFSLLNSAFAQSADTDSLNRKIKVDSLNFNTVSGNVPIKSASNGNKKNSFWQKVPYEVDDIAVYAGLNHGGLHYTKQYREHEPIPGYQIGLLNYFPLLDKAFCFYGLQFSKRGFRHRGNQFNTNYLDLPLSLGYELPVGQAVDFRLQLGFQFSALVHAAQQGDYNITDDSDFYRYEPQRFKSWDMGYHFGFSAEYANFFAHCKVYYGLNKLMPNDQGMLYGLFLNVGYLPFRNLR